MEQAKTMEPTPEALGNPVARYALATRPPFLVVTLIGAFIGYATACAARVPLQGVPVARALGPARKPGRA